MDTQSNINQARQVFDRDLHSPAYDRLLADSEHLAALVNLMALQPGRHYLDIGTGNGYVAFELARMFPESFISGLDIAPNAIHTNQTRQQELGLTRLNFKLFDGYEYPFENGWFQGAVTRYAFHHFPDPATTLKEIRRILVPGASIVVSDPLTAEDDPTLFIDDFQRLRPDGHIHFYRQQELMTLFQQNGFEAGKTIFSQLSYPRELTPAYTRLLEATPPEILKKYGVDIRDQQVYVTVQVLNVRFRKLE